MMKENLPAKRPPRNTSLDTIREIFLEEIKLLYLRLRRDAISSMVRDPYKNLRGD